MLCIFFFSENSLHLYGTFFIFGSVLVILLPICYIILPETKDISLGEFFIDYILTNSIQI